MPQFTLTVVTSADGYIARAPDDAPQSWASAEEQALFFAEVENADWTVMGRRTHEAADKPDRRRIIFSSLGGKRGVWRRETQLWIDPTDLRPEALPDLVTHLYDFETVVILGGTRVHDWFLHHGAVDRVHLTIEPLRFGQGLPIFSDQTTDDPEAVLTLAGFTRASDRVLNTQGTRYQVWEPTGT